MTGRENEDGTYRKARAGAGGGRCQGQLPDRCLACPAGAGLDAGYHHRGQCRHPERLLFTMGKAREAEELWRSLEIHDVLEVPESLKREELRAFFLDIFRSGGLNVEPLAETIDRLIDEDAVRHSAIHFGLVMTELGSCAACNARSRISPRDSSRTICWRPAPASLPCAHGKLTV